MAHHVYQTDGLILHSSPEGEASRFYRVLTRELGLVGAVAKSVRLEKSKLRYSLQDYSRASVSLVRGKDVWRIVNAVPIGSFYSDFRGSKVKLAACARISALLRKLLAGEERHEEIFDLALSTFEFLKDDGLTREDVALVQLIAALRILHVLGYGSGGGELESFARSDRWDRETLASFVPLAPQARVSIQKALAASHL